MSFRKRNVGLSSGVSRDPGAVSTPSASVITHSLPGLRPSPLDGRATTSTGTPTLDSLLAGHAGLPMGTSMLIEENGTTDYAGALLRYYAAEGLVQGHRVHILGVPEPWGRDLPGLIDIKEKEKPASNVTEKMKIAWRYERMGQPGIGANSRGGRSVPCDSIALDQYRTSAESASVRQNRMADSTLTEQASEQDMKGDQGGAPSFGEAPSVFCHTFDLTKRLIHPPDSFMTFLKVDTTKPHKSPYALALTQLTSILTSSPRNSVHRLVIPSLLSPALYPPHASSPEHVLQFLHNLRALISKYSSRLTAMLTLPLSLYPRSMGLVRWMELLSDGVVELSPFPHSYQPDAPSTTSGTGTATSQDDPPQGLLKLHRLPILHERGVGTTAVDEDWAFTLSRRKFTIKPFSLPPVEGDTEAQQAASPKQNGKKAELDF